MRGEEIDEAPETRSLTPGSRRDASCGAAGESASEHVVARLCRFSGRRFFTRPAKRTCKLHASLRRVALMHRFRRNRTETVAPRSAHTSRASPPCAPASTRTRATPHAARRTRPRPPLPVPPPPRNPSKSKDRVDPRSGSHARPPSIPLPLLRVRPAPPRCWSTRDPCSTLPLPQRLPRATTATRRRPRRPRWARRRTSGERTRTRTRARTRSSGREWTRWTTTTTTTTTSRRRPLLRVSYLALSPRARTSGERTRSSGRERRRRRRRR